MTFNSESHAKAPDWSHRIGKLGLGEELVDLAFGAGLHSFGEILYGNTGNSPPANLKVDFVAVNRFA